MPYVYIGQADGPKILRYGEGHKLLQPGGASVVYQSRLEMWELMPAGPKGSVVYRSIDVKLRHTLGYSVKITPVVDGVAEPTQTFSAGPPAGSLLEELAELSARLAARGTDIAVIVELDSTYARQEIETVEASGVPLRRIP